MYSKEIEHKCGLCVFSEPAKGVITHIRCKKRNEYMATGHAPCNEYKYDIFKKKVRRKKDKALQGFSPEDFAL